MYVCAIADEEPGCGEQTLIALFRLWHRHRRGGANPVPAMASLAAEHGEVSGLSADTAAQLAVACDSFLALTEACLGRALQPGSDSELSADERALLTTLRQVPVLEAVGPTPLLPHGLPGALQWAAFAVLRWINVGQDEEGEQPMLLACPYAAGDGMMPSP